MTNIILQHFDGALRELDRLSIENMSNYAKSIGAEYQLIRGKPFNSELTAPCQKAIIISDIWDKYDDVLMVDIDMFVTKTCDVDVFTIKGNSTHGEVQKRLHRRLVTSGIIDQKSPYWAGCIYKLNQKERELMRKARPIFDNSWMDKYNVPYNFEDEGILAELAHRAKLPASYMPWEWSQCSFLPEPEKAKMIHIRTKITPTGPKREKIENYNALVERGIL